MKNLILVRHAKSSWDRPGLPDIERPLNKRGLRDAPFMADVLKKKEIKPNLIISSPANRAYTTAKIFAEHLDYDIQNILKESDLYLADVEEFLSVLKQIDDSISTIMLFSHNPGLLYFLHYLTDTKLDDFPTCAVISLSLSTESWKQIKEKSAKILFYEYPKKYLD